MNHAVFLDRDGTLIKQVEVLTSPDQLELLPGVAQAIARLKAAGFVLIGITNQPSIEKGLLSQEQSDAINVVLQQMLEAAGGERLDKIYTCPHKFRAEGQCGCRKPGQKLIQEAAAEFGIDLSRSWFVGDRLRDVATGRAGGMKTVRVHTGGESGDDAFFEDRKPDYDVADLTAAVDAILQVV